MTSEASAHAQTPGIGHNQPPPDPIKSRLQLLIDLGLPKIADRIEAIVRAANKWRAGIAKIENAEVAAACQGFIDQANAERDAVEEARKAAAKPHDDGKAKVQAAFKPVLELLAECADGMRPLKKGWLDHLDAEQEAQRKKTAFEAEDLAAKARAVVDVAQAPGAKVEDIIVARETIAKAEAAQETHEEAVKAKPRVTSDFGSRASGFREEWSAEITDWKLAAGHYSGHAAVQEVIQKVANKDAKNFKKAGEMHPGVKAKSEKKV